MEMNRIVKQLLATSYVEMYINSRLSGHETRS